MRKFMNLLRINFEFFCEIILNLGEFKWYRAYRGGCWFRHRCSFTGELFWSRRCSTMSHIEQLENYEGN